MSEVEQLQRIRFDLLRGRAKKLIARALAADGLDRSVAPVTAEAVLMDFEEVCRADERAKRDQEWAAKAAAAALRFDDAASVLLDMGYEWREADGTWHKREGDDASA